VNKGLFRQQVLKNHTHRLHGDILLVPQLSYSLVLGLLLFWVVLALYWLVSSTYARKVTVVGWLEPSTGVIRVYAEGTGIIKKVLIGEGDSVIEGQPLIIVNGDRILTNGTYLEALLLAEYETQRTLLTDQIERSRSIYQRRELDVTQRITAAQEDLALLGQQKDTLEQRLALITEKVTRYKKLSNNQHISSSDRDLVIGASLELRSERQALSRSQVSQRNTIQQLQTESQLLPDEHDNTLGELKERLSNIAQQIAQLSGRRAHVIKAPRAGVVNSLQVREGQQAQSGIPLLTLIPKNAKLTARLLVPVRSVGFVEAGQYLDIRYDAFSYQKFGLYQAKVKSVSDTILLPGELLSAPVSTQEPVYSLYADLSQPSVQAYGRDFSLKSGMTLSADIRLEDRSLNRWLLEPIYSLKGRL
jgi:membrane fusion protein